jgi:Adenylate cyclase associated (CAP) C terminal
VRAGAKSGSAAGKPARLECEQGRKWIVENYIGNAGIVVSDTNPKQSVYISNCHDSVIKVCTSFMLHTNPKQSVYISNWKDSITKVCTSFLLHIPIALTRSAACFCCPCRSPTVRSP